VRGFLTGKERTSSVTCAWIQSLLKAQPNAEQSGRPDASMLEYESHQQEQHQAEEKRQKVHDALMSSSCLISGIRSAAAT
jgi:hypothetical protein